MLTVLQEKATEVYESYGAVILVVDRRGRSMSNLSTAYAHDPDFVASLDSA